MAPSGTFNSKNPTIKRILKEASELSRSPSPDFTAHPLESNIFEWHFTLSGPPSSPYSSGIYHGRIVLPTSYPLRPPSFRFLTPSGRFETNREICLSISGHHEETWQPAWGIRTALVAIRSFMVTEAGGQVGGLERDEAERRGLAGKSRGWRCGTCEKSNESILGESAARAREKEEQTGRAQAVEEVPEELKLAYRDELGAEAGKEPEGSQAGPPLVSRESTAASANTPPATGTSIQQPSSNASQLVQRRPVTSTAAAPVPQTAVVPPQRRQSSDDVWLDKTIAVVGGLLAVILLRRILSWL